jgi:AraC-like DNA-binding protein
MAAGGELRFRRFGPSAPVLYLGMEGNTRVQGPNGFTLIPGGHVEVRYAETSLLFLSRLGSRGIALLVPQEKLRLSPQSSGARRSTPSELSHPVGLSPEDNSLAARLLRDCLAGIAAQITGGQNPRQIEWAGALIGVLLKEALAEKQRGGEQLGDNSIPWYVAAAEQELQKRVSDPLSVTDLARAAGVSPRTLHDGFRRHRGASPMRMLRRQRMQQVRKELTEPNDTTSVTDTALKWGFNHLGRFSAYYVAQFGEKPSETLRVSRTRR